MSSKITYARLKNNENKNQNDLIFVKNFINKKATKEDLQRLKDLVIKREIELNKSK